LSFLFDPPPLVSAPVIGEAARFPVHRIYCVGRNYAAHVREMGGDPDREKPFFFLKPADALIDTDLTIPYPANTSNFHYEIELVVAIGSGGSDIPIESALDHVYGYAVGIDLTRRDRQLEMRDKGRPWDIGKGFDRSAPMAAIYKASQIGHIDRGDIWLKVGDAVKQQSDIANLIWSVPEVISILSRSWELKPGDLIFTGTPDGVGPLQAGDTAVGGIKGLGEVRVTIAR
jgi:fumarylpyruvate hydrolase